MSNCSKKHYAVIGHPIGHTMSPFIHEQLFRLTGEDADYSVFDIAPEELPEKEKELLSKLDGYNVTIPNKRAILPLLDEIDGKAKLYGSVNTVKNGGKKTGSSTDPVGFVRALESDGIALAGEVVVLGAGGVSRIMACEAGLAGCRLTIATREKSVADAKTLAKEVEALTGNPVETCLLSEIAEKKSRIDLMVNGTSVGMYPHADAMPVSEEAVARCGAIFDAVYNPEETLLLRCGKEKGVKVLGGMSMLVWQAAEAQRIWSGAQFRESDINAIIRAASEEMVRKFGA